MRLTVRVFGRKIIEIAREDEPEPARKHRVGFAPQHDN